MQLLGATLIKAPFDLLTIFSVLIGGDVAICSYFFSGAYIRKYTVIKKIEKLSRDGSAKRYTKIVGIMV